MYQLVSAPEDFIPPKRTEPILFFYITRQEFIIVHTDGKHTKATDEEIDEMTKEFWGKCNHSRFVKATSKIKARCIDCGCLWKTLFDHVKDDGF
jgi:hypothetical protein